MPAVQVPGIALSWRPLHGLHRAPLGGAGLSPLVGLSEKAWACSLHAPRRCGVNVIIPTSHRSAARFGRFLAYPNLAQRRRSRPARRGPRYHGAARPSGVGQSPTPPCLVGERRQCPTKRGLPVRHHRQFLPSYTRHGLKLSSATHIIRRNEEVERCCITHTAPIWTPSK